jgi:hypothetical protein
MQCQEQAAKMTASKMRLLQTHSLQLTVMSTRSPAPGLTSALEIKGMLVNACSSCSSCSHPDGTSGISSGFVDAVTAVLLPMAPVAAVLHLWPGKV